MGLGSWLQRQNGWPTDERPRQQKPSALQSAQHQAHARWLWRIEFSSRESGVSSLRRQVKKVIACRTSTICSQHDSFSRGDNKQRMIPLRGCVQRRTEHPDHVCQRPPAPSVRCRLHSLAGRSQRRCQPLSILIRVAARASKANIPLSQRFLLTLHSVQCRSAVRIA